MSGKLIYVEGGGSSRELQGRCREAFRLLLQKSGLEGRVPRIVACGSRNDTYKEFVVGIKSGRFDYVVLLVDSEDLISDVNQPWTHLTARDQWPKPEGAVDEQVFLMATSMETWIVADRVSLKKHYGAKLRESALPPLRNLEQRDRHEVQAKLQAATRECTNAYSKGKRSFDVLAAVDPATLKEHLPSFARMVRILEEKL